MFIRYAVMNGLQWANRVLSSVGNLLALLALCTAFGISGGLLLHKPWWTLVAVLVVASVVIFTEGAYRAWDEASSRASTSPGPASLSIAVRHDDTMERCQGFARLQGDQVVLSVDCSRWEHRDEL